MLAAYGLRPLHSPFADRLVGICVPLKQLVGAVFPAERRRLAHRIQAVFGRISIE
jgi:hypothetical protein